MCIYLDTVFMQYKTTCAIMNFQENRQKLSKFIKCSILADKMEQQLKVLPFVKSLPLTTLTN